MSDHIPEATLALLAGGDLEAGEAGRARAHIGRCARCAGLLDEYRQWRDSTAALGTDDFSVSDYRSLRAAVLDRVQGAAIRPVWGWIPHRRAIAAAAAIVLVSLGSLWMRSAIKARVAAPPLQAVVPRHEGVISPPKMPGSPAAIRSDARALLKQHHIPVKRAPSENPWYLAYAGPAQSLPGKTRTPDDIAIKMETADPNVIIIWLASQREEER